jgi:hypothetical protein
MGSEQSSDYWLIVLDISNRLEELDDKSRPQDPGLL